MKFGIVLLATAVSARNLLHIGAPQDKVPKVVSIDIERRLPSDIPSYERRRLRRRQSTVEISLDNEQTLYFANITLGTPPQQIRLHIDTGSSDLWVNTANSTFCARSRRCNGGTFSATASSTNAVVNDKFKISYIDGSGASGNYVSDTLAFGGVTMPAFQFGLGTQSTSTEGVMGIGYVSNEMQVLRNKMAAYPNLPMALLKNGHIARNAYSLWLNDMDASTGTILFGGINTAKFQGELATLPVIQARAGYVELAVAMTGLAVNGQNVSTNEYPLAALLDSGSTVSYLPSVIANAVYSQLGGAVNITRGAPYAPCELRNKAGTVDFTFSGKTIAVGYDELLLDLGTDASGNPYTLDNGQTACMFGIAPIGGDAAILGDTFLRSAYVVYDLDNDEISLAQTIFNTTESDVRAIPAGSAPLPGAVRSRDADETAAQVEQVAAPPSNLGKSDATTSSNSCRGFVFSSASTLFIAFAVALFSV